MAEVVSTNTSILNFELSTRFQLTLQVGNTPAAEGILKALKKNFSITSLTLSKHSLATVANCVLAAKAAFAVAELIERTSTLTQLVLCRCFIEVGENELKSEGAKVIAKGCSKYSTIELLSICIGKVL